MEKKAELYRGKAKTVYATDDPEKLIIFFRNDTSAFDGLKIQQFNNKGMINNKFNYFIMKKLEAAGIPTQVEGLLSDTELLVKKLEMVPVECVVRNYTAGSICKRLPVKEGQKLETPTFEFFLKDDALHDPMVNQLAGLPRSYRMGTQEDIDQMKALSLKINDVLKKLFDDAGLILVDFKLEFGKFHGQLLLGDEFSPDGCRLWDKKTMKKLDKDRFRQNLGGVMEAYEEVAHRIGVPL